MSLLSGTCGVGFVRAVPVFFCLVSFSFFLPSPALFLYLLLISLGPGALSRGPKCPFIHDTTIKTRIPATVCVCIYISCLLSAPFDMAVDTEIMKNYKRKTKGATSLNARTETRWMTATIFIDHQQLPTFWCLPLHFLTNRKKKLAPSKITNERNKKKGANQITRRHFLPTMRNAVVSEKRKWP